MSNQKIRIATVIFVFLGLIGTSFLVGFNAGELHPKVIKVVGLTNLESKNGPPTDFGTFWQAWDIVNNKYLNASSVSDQKKVYGAVSGLVRSLGDPHSEFFNPDDGKKFEEDIKGNFGGIGAEISVKNDQLVVVAPLDNTPASRGGLRPKDAILSINSSSTDGMSADEAVKIIRGPIGTKVTLTIARDGWQKPKDLTFIRDTIVVPTLDFEMKAGDIAYINLHSFNGNSNLLFGQAITKALTAGSRGLVLDLRNNPGGYLQVAIDLAGWFFPRNTLVVKEAYRDKTDTQYFSSGNAVLKDFPVVVLVNNGSASASEILAGALRDNRKIKLIGEKTFGKGTVQEVEDLFDGSTIKLTIANWVMPSGLILEGTGLSPDLEVKMTDQDFEKKRDPQLDKALEVLKSEIDKNKNVLFKIK